MFTVCHDLFAIHLGVIDGLFLDMSIPFSGIYVLVVFNTVTTSLYKWVYHIILRHSSVFIFVFLGIIEPILESCVPLKPMLVGVASYLGKSSSA